MLLKLGEARDGADEAAEHPLVLAPHAPRVLLDGLAHLVVGDSLHGEHRGTGLFVEQGGLVVGEIGRAHV